MKHKIRCFNKTWEHLQVYLYNYATVRHSYIWYVATTGGVYLAEEIQDILATNSELKGITNFCEAKEVRHLICKVI